jgi:hypothetical protein
MHSHFRRSTLPKYDHFFSTGKPLHKSGVMETRYLILFGLSRSETYVMCVGRLLGYESDFLWQGGGREEQLICDAFFLEDKRIAQKEKQF